MLGYFSQAKLPITNQDDVGTMFEKLSLLGKELLLKTLPKILSGELKPMPQAEEQATFSPILRKNKKQLIGQRQHRRSTIRSEGCDRGQLLSRLTKGAVGRFGQ